MAKKNPLVVISVVCAIELSYLTDLEINGNGQLVF